jgi:hypothetical protein
MTITHNALSERAMLVNLSISIWSARKHDVRISDKIAAEHGADRSMGRYAKHLIPRGLLTAVNAANTALRDHHNLNTLAWGDDGTRILPAANYLGYQAQQQTLEDAFGRAVRDFVASYPDYVETARKSLNGLFDPRDYPTAAQIDRKFAVRRHFMPVAQPDDFRVQLDGAQVARIRAEIEVRNAELVANANRDLWQRVQEVTSRLVDRLSAFQVDPCWTSSRASTSPPTRGSSRCARTWLSKSPAMTRRPYARMTVCAPKSSMPPAGFWRRWRGTADEHRIRPVRQGPCGAVGERTVLGCAVAAPGTGRRFVDPDDADRRHLDPLQPGLCCQPLAQPAAHVDRA